MGIQFFLGFALKHRLWVLVKTASVTVSFALRLMFNVICRRARVGLTMPVKILMESMPSCGRRHRSDTSASDVDQTTLDSSTFSWALEDWSR